MIVYKLFRLKEGKLFPLFINRQVETKVGEWLAAECYPTKGFAVRQGWHCCITPFAPHLKTELASGEKRVWVECVALECEKYQRPESQGGEWVLAQLLKVNKILTPEEVEKRRYEAALEKSMLKNGATFTPEDRYRLWDEYDENKKALEEKLKLEGVI